MKQYARQLRQTLFVVLALFVGSVLAISAYSLWRLRSDALTSGLDLAAMHAQRIEDVLTQSLHVTELIAANIATHENYQSDLPHVVGDFATTLRRLPFLRSISLAGDDGRIVASSNAANVGRVVSTEDYLPTPAVAGGEIMRIGRPWAGRDFATGWPNTLQASSAADAASFIPVAQALVLGGRRLTLLVALNPDYFVNYVAQKLDASEGNVDVLRYDGLRLLSSAADRLPGSLRDVRDLHLADVEFGQSSALASGDGGDVLTAFRASHLYPLVVLTEIRRDYALRHWQTEAKTLLWVVVPLLLAISALSLAFYRRQMLLIEQRAEFARLQRINATVFESSSVAILVADDLATIVSLNAEYTRLSGYTRGELIGHPLRELLTDDGAAIFAEKTRPPAGDAPNGAASFELEHRCKDGRLIWMEVHSTPERDARGRITGYHRICRNITERKQMEDRVRQLAFHDALTQLPNRRLLGDRLAQAIAASSRSGCYGALMFLDLDNFKSLNDLHGHGVGDLLLIEAAQRLARSVRVADTVARFGGDEFVVMLGVLSADRVESHRLAATIAEKIRVALAAPYRLPSDPASQTFVEHRCTASIGVALFISHDVVQDDLLKWADAAMYRAKDAGSDRVCFHDAPLPL